MLRRTTTGKLEPANGSKLRLFVFGLFQVPSLPRQASPGALLATSWEIFTKSSLQAQLASAVLKIRSGSSGFSAEIP
jgi:hypothetical protein